MGTIYKITNTVNGKSYIGQTTQPVSQRLHQHIKKAPNPVLKNAINKYGKEAFVCEVLHENVTEDMLDALEIEAIKLHNTITPHGYNINHGGHKNRIFSDQARQKMSEAKKGKPSKRKRIKHTPKSRRKMSEALKGRTPHNKGKKHTPETRKKMSDWQRGRKLTPEHRKNIGESGKGRVPWNKGRKHTAKAREKMSEANRGRRFSETHKENLSKANRGPHCDAAYQMFQSLPDDLSLLEKRKILLSEFEGKLHPATIYKWVRKWTD